jgi:hypothetical protein
MCHGKGFLSYVSRIFFLRATKIFYTAVQLFFFSAEKIIFCGQLACGLRMIFGQSHTLFDTYSRAIVLGNAGDLMGVLGGFLE